MHISTQKNIEIKSPADKFFFSRIFPLIFLASGIGLFYVGYTDMELAKESIT
ncbi:MAG: hypothetical protein PF574_01155 [Candidatus Delongbacteria bacterium]|jgi:hypothetical protein|nr:hypothetical protein [Candidatus Delongbacteria bacterium]